MYMINHFLDTTILGQAIFVPNKAKLNETNAETGSGSIGFHVSNCNALYGRNPNIILLDYYDSNGNAPFNAAASMNGIAAPTNTVSAGNAGSDATATATGVGNGIVSTSPLNNGAVDVAPKTLLSFAAVAIGVVVGAALV